jgi:lipopolysaccharide transport system ATP-binding protein
MGDMIRVDGLSKKYTIGRKETHNTLRDALVNSWRSAWRRPAAGEADPRDLWALDDVSFKVAHGEILGVIGRNGSGKSTLLKILSRITEPTRGRAEVRGQVASLLEVGTGFHPELTGRENVFVNGAILGMKRRDIIRKFDEIVGFADIDRFIDTAVKRYSSGMKMRLAFAVAAHLDPHILLIDEVLAVGDAQFQRKCLNSMAETARSGRTVLFVSHQLNQIRKLCTTGLWLDRGKIAMSGPASEVASAYEEHFSGRGVDVTSTRVRDPHATEFVNWSLTGGEGELAHTVVDGDSPVSVTFRLHMARTVKNARHSVALYSSENVLIWAYEFDNLPLDAGFVDLTYRFPFLPLRPGVYHWDLSLWEDNNPLDRWSAVPPMRIHGQMWTHASEAWQGVLNVKFSMQLRTAHTTLEPHSMETGPVAV